MCWKCKTTLNPFSWNTFLLSKQWKRNEKQIALIHISFCHTLHFPREWFCSRLLCKRKVHFLRRTSWQKWWSRLWHRQQKHSLFNEVSVVKQHDDYNGITSKMQRSQSKKSPVSSRQLVVDSVFTACMSLTIQLPFCSNSWEYNYLRNSSKVLKKQEILFLWRRYNLLSNFIMRISLIFSSPFCVHKWLTRNQTVFRRIQAPLLDKMQFITGLTSDSSRLL